jgi:hypothetical protein
LAEQEVKYKVVVDDSELSAKLAEIRNQLDLVMGQAAMASTPLPQASQLVGSVQGYAMPETQAITPALDPMTPGYDASALATSYTYSPPYTAQSFAQDLDSMAVPAQLGFSKFTADMRRAGLAVKSRFPDYEMPIPQTNREIYGPKGFLGVLDAMTLGMKYDGNNPLSIREYSEIAANKAAKQTAAFLTNDLTLGIGAAGLAAGVLGATALLPVFGAVTAAAAVGKFVGRNQIEEAGIAEGFKTIALQNFGAISREESMELARTFTGVMRSDAARAQGLDSDLMQQVLLQFNEAGGFSNTNSVAELQRKTKSIVEDAKVISQTLGVAMEEVGTLMGELERSGQVAVERFSEVASRAKAAGRMAGISSTDMLGYGLQMQQMTMGTLINPTDAVLGGIEARMSAERMTGDPFGQFLSNSLGGPDNVGRMLFENGHRFGKSGMGMFMTAAAAGGFDVNQLGTSGSLLDMVSSGASYLSGDIRRLVGMPASQDRLLSAYSPDDLNAFSIGTALSVLDTMPMLHNADGRINADILATTMVNMRLASTPTEALAMISAQRAAAYAQDPEITGAVAEISDIADASEVTPWMQMKADIGKAWNNLTTSDTVGNAGVAILGEIEDGVKNGIYSLNGITRVSPRRRVSAEVTSLAQEVLAGQLANQDPNYVSPEDVLRRLTRGAGDATSQEFYALKEGGQEYLSGAIGSAEGRRGLAAAADNPLRREATTFLNTRMEGTDKTGLQVVQQALKELDLSSADLQDSSKVHEALALKVFNQSSQDLSQAQNIALQQVVRSSPTSVSQGYKESEARADTIAAAVKEEVGENTPSVEAIRNRIIQNSDKFSLKAFFNFGTSTDALRSLSRGGDEYLSGAIGASAGREGMKLSRDSEVGEQVAEILGSEFGDTGQTGLKAIQDAVKALDPAKYDMTDANVLNQAVALQLFNKSSTELTQAQNTAIQTVLRTRTSLALSKDADERGELVAETDQTLRDEKAVQGNLIQVDPKLRRAANIFAEFSHIAENAPEFLGEAYNRLPAADKAALADSRGLGLDRKAFDELRATPEAFKQLLQNTRQVSANAVAADVQAILPEALKEQGLEGKLNATGMGRFAGHLASLIGSGQEISLRGDRQLQIQDPTRFKELVAKLNDSELNSEEQKKMRQEIANSVAFTSANGQELFMSDGQGGLAKVDPLTQAFDFQRRAIRVTSEAAPRASAVN